MAYATYANLAVTTDANTIAELCGDDGSPNPGPNAVTSALLDRATEDIRGYARVGAMYSDDQLDGLALANNAALWGLCCDLATCYLFDRRSTEYPPQVQKRYERAMHMLEQLRDGKTIFGALDAAAVAGLPTVVAVPLQLLSAYGAA